MASQIQIRRDSASNWTSTDPTLAQGEIGYETDTRKMKVGDGSTAWTSLPYFFDASLYLLVDGSVASTGPVEIPSDEAFYLGDKTTEGSWRIIRDGDNLLFQRYESSVWTSKGGMSA